MSQKQTSTLLDFLDNMDIEEAKKQEKKEATESDEKPDEGKSDEKLSDHDIDGNDCKDNRKVFIFSNDFEVVKTTKTSKEKSPNKKERKQLFLDSYIDLLNYILE